jgi:hypothetical protein
MNHELKKLLLHRLQVIGDKSAREKNPEEHLRQLQIVSEAISHWHVTHRSNIPAQLNHYLIQASYDKALDFISKP